MLHRKETVQNQLDKLTHIAAQALASIQALERVTAAHDSQIGTLIELASQHEAAIANLERQWQAYLSTIHPKQ